MQDVRRNVFAPAQAVAVAIGAMTNGNMRHIAEYGVPP